MNAKQAVASYLILQTVSILVWWSVLFFFPYSITWFQPAEWPRQALLGFWLADLLLLAGGSIATAFAILANKSWSALAIWALAAAAWYPTLYCIGVSLITDQAWIASATMVCMAGLTLAMATVHGTADQQPAGVRVVATSKKTALTWTFFQIVIFWGVFLWVLPKGILEVEQLVGWQGFKHPLQAYGSLGLFTAASALGFASAYTLATLGNGTPLPTATAPIFVVAGPYRWVRNPMALAGISQGLAIGWFLGSYSVLVYALAGALVWHFWVRHVEEADLQERFGEEYRQYRASVGLWLPKPKL